MWFILGSSKVLLTRDLAELRINFNISRWRSRCATSLLQVFPLM